MNKRPESPPQMNNILAETLARGNDEKSCLFFERGLSLSALGSIKDKYMTLREEVKAECLNVELLKYIDTEFYSDGKDKDAVGTVNIYISYSSDQDVCSLIDCIVGWQADYEAKEGKKHMKFFYWVDRLCASKPVYRTDLTLRKTLLEKARTVVLVLPTWNNFESMREANCLLEIALATQMDGTSFGVTFPREDHVEFEKSCSDINTFVTIMDGIENVANFERAVGDLEAVRRQEYSTHMQDGWKFRMLVIRAMRSYYIECIKDFAEKSLRGPIIHRVADEKSEERSVWSLLYAAGVCTRLSGEFNKSVEFLSKAAEWSEDRNLSNNVSTALRLEWALSCAKNKWYPVAEKLLNELSSSLEGMSEERRHLAEVAAAECFLAKGDLKMAGDILKRQALDKDSVLGSHTLARLADLDSREGKYDEADHKFRQATGPVERPPPMEVDACNYKALNELMFAEHLVRKVLDTNMTTEDREKALMEAKGYLSRIQNLVMMFSDMKGERHPDSKKTSDILLELTLLVKPEQLKEKYLSKDGGMVRAWSATPCRSANSIVILHWNILADALAFADLVKDGFACDNHVLSWQNNRKDKIITEILKHDPDVFGLVELDHYDDLRCILSRFGYESVWMKKNRDFYKDGGAIFWKRARFVKVDELLTTLKKNGKNTDQVLVSVRLAPLVMRGTVSLSVVFT